MTPPTARCTRTRRSTTSSASGCACAGRREPRSLPPYHLQHHKFAQQAEDPDLGLSAPFPITRASLRRKIVRDLTGQTWFKQRFGDCLQAS